MRTLGRLCFHAVAPTLPLVVCVFVHENSTCELFMCTVIVLRIVYVNDQIKPFLTLTGRLALIIIHEIL